MSALAAQVRERAQRLATRQELKILVLDIERLKGHFLWPGSLRYDGLTIEGDFWDLSDYKRTIGRIPHDVVTDWPRMICVAWRFLGERQTSFASEWDDGQEQMHRRIWEAVNEADIITGHNIRAFDLKHLNTGWRDLGMTPPSPAKPIDTLTIARQQFGDESKTLDALCKRLGLTGKTDRYDVELARAACAGDKKAQRKIRSYNAGDIDASEALYVTLLPWIRNHPHTAPNAGTDTVLCPRCASSSVRRNGTWTVYVNTYLKYLCNDCGGHWKTTFEARGPSVKTL